MNKVHLDTLKGLSIMKQKRGHSKDLGAHIVTAGAVCRYERECMHQGRVDIVPTSEVCRISRFLRAHPNRTSTLLQELFLFVVNTDQNS